MRRHIIFDKSFDAAVESLGGYRAIDRAIDTIIDSLDRNPYAFPKFENDFISFRYAMTKPVDDLPSLVVIFSIGEDKNVTLEHVEENPGY